MSECHLHNLQKKAALSKAAFLLAVVLMIINSV